MTGFIIARDKLPVCARFDSGERQNVSPQQPLARKGRTAKKLKNLLL